MNTNINNSKPKSDDDKKRVQLQAKSDHESRLTFSMDVLARQDLEFCQAFISQGLNVDASAAVIIRRALSALRQHLACIVIDSQLNDQVDLTAFMGKLELERDELFHAAGRRRDQHKWER